MFGLVAVLCSVMSDSATPCIVARQAPLSMGSSRQEYWSGLPFPTPGIFLTQGSNPCLLHLQHCRQILYHWVTWEAQEVPPNGLSTTMESADVCIYWCPINGAPLHECPSEQQGEGESHGMKMVIFLDTSTSSGSIFEKKKKMGCSESPWDARYCFPNFRFPCLHFTLSQIHVTSQVALVVKNPSANAGDVGLIPGLGRLPGRGLGNPL